jgi:hypothetical protein
MPKYLNTALYFEGRAKRAKNADRRDRFMAAARKYRDLAAEEASLKATTVPSEPKKSD